MLRYSLEFRQKIMTISSTTDNKRKREGDDGEQAQKYAKVIVANTSVHFDSEI